MSEGLLAGVTHIDNVGKECISLWKKAIGVAGSCHVTWLLHVNWAEQEDCQLQNTTRQEAFKLEELK